MTRLSTNTSGLHSGAVATVAGRGKGRLSTWNPVLPGRATRRNRHVARKAMRKIPGSDDCRSADAQIKKPPSVDSTLSTLDKMLGGDGQCDPVSNATEEAAVTTHAPGSSSEGTVESRSASSPPFSDARNGGDPLAVPTAQPRLAYALLALNLAVYGVGVGIALAGDAEASNDYFLALAKDNQAVLENGELYRLLTSNFMHAGLLHLGLNCAALIGLGPEAESVLGYSRFLFIYISAGLSGSLASLVFSESVTVGASGALLGLVGALMGYFLRNPALSRAGWQFGFLAVTAILNIGIGLDGDGLVDNTGHVAGLLTGLALGIGMGPRWVAPDSRTNQDPGTGEKESPAFAIDATPQVQQLAVGVSFAGLQLLTLASMLLIGDR